MSQQPVECDASVITPTKESSAINAPIVTPDCQARFFAQSGDPISATRQLVEANILPDARLIAAPPADTLGGGVERQSANFAVLLNADAKPEDKMRAARELAQGGTTQLTGQRQDGTAYSLRLELEPAGSGQMVHVHMTGPDGKERVALRGIAKADGTFEQERNASGQRVSYEGSMGSVLKDMKSLKVGNRSDSGDQYVSIDPVLPDFRTDSDGMILYRDRRFERERNGGGRYAPGAINRSQFDQELRDPRVMAAFAGRMRSEVGSQGPAAQLAFAEEVMNRAASRNQTLMQALSGSYYPTSHPGRSDNPAFIAAITKAWQEGTDTIFGATGNASGRVGFGKRGGYFDRSLGHWVSPNQTVHINGERFGYEQVDLNRGWMAKYQALKHGSRDEVIVARNQTRRRQS